MEHMIETKIAYMKILVGKFDWKGTFVRRGHRLKIVKNFNSLSYIEINC